MSARALESETDERPRAEAVGSDAQQGDARVGLVGGAAHDLVELPLGHATGDRAGDGRRVSPRVAAQRVATLVDEARARFGTTPT